MGQSNTAIYTFSGDRPVFLREYSTDHYSVFPYFLSKLGSEAINSFCAVLAQAVIVYWMIGLQMSFFEFFAITYTLALTATAVAVWLGSFFEEAKSASALFVLVVVPQFYFSGLFIAIDLIPVWIQWLQYICSVMYASRLSFAYEFQNCDPGPAAENCANVLDSNQVDESDTWWYWLALWGIFCMFRFGSVYVLHSKAKY
jgi:ABC-type multidrug transport system permease subunit